MPSTTIDVRRRWTDAEEVAIIDAVHAALVSAFAIPRTLVTVDCFSGRSVEAERRLFADVVQNLAPPGIPTDHVSITVRDLPRENWGIRGGQSALDVDLGFVVEV